MASAPSVPSELNECRRRLEAVLADHRHARRTARLEKAALADASRRASDLAAAAEITQRVAAAVQESVHAQIAAVVSRCLRAVFEEDAFEFKIRFERKRGRTEALLLFERDGREVDPTGASGIGQVVVAALALRVAAVLLVRPALRRLLVMDEPLRQINGAEYQERVAGLLLGLAEELDFQFLIASDEAWMKFGKVVEIGEGS